VLRLRVGPSEDGAFWYAFLRSLVARGLSGVRLVTSDAHEGLKQAIAEVFVRAAWMRWRVHTIRTQSPDRLRRRLSVRRGLSPSGQATVEYLLGPARSLLQPVRRNRTIRRAPLRWSARVNDAPFTRTITQSVRAEDEDGSQVARLCSRFLKASAAPYSMFKDCSPTRGDGDSPI